ncbi:MAG: S-adenosylhomocysteine deaminase, partial [Saprospiraceae bacterium]|nr:S-adenosylhomocysteine deaminase [Saprospiraceae bacterium]
MKIEKFAADLILTVSGSPLENYVVVTDENGTILSLDPLDQHDPASVNHLKGILTPGFVNTHCHLELSHLKGVAETGTGLLPFLTKVVSM